ncbi:MAG: DUF6106 family protein [Lachnospiraceae bacterium]
MSENYIEILVKKESTFKNTLLRSLCIALTALMFFLGMSFGLLFLIVAIGFGILTYIVWLHTDIEYEYLYLDKELQIDKIMARTKRKKAATFEIERMEMLAPANSYHLDEYRKRTFKESDYSSGHKSQPDTRYVMIYNGEQRIILENKPELANIIKTVAPRKVFLD